MNGVGGTEKSKYALFSKTTEFASPRLLYLRSDDLFSSRSTPQRKKHVNHQHSSFSNCLRFVIFLHDVETVMKTQALLHPQLLH